MTIQEQTRALQYWEPPEPLALWMLFDDCVPTGAEAVTATVGWALRRNLCRLDGVVESDGRRKFSNVAVSWWTPDIWSTFAHEVTLLPPAFNNLTTRALILRATSPRPIGLDDVLLVERGDVLRELSALWWSQTTSCKHLAVAGAVGSPKSLLACQICVID